MSLYKKGGKRVLDFAVSVALLIVLLPNLLSAARSRYGREPPTSVTSPGMAQIE